ncbi:hypothetical protein TSMEX_009300 [Taenia solium]|eukprot:TsM_000768100 transcript=TsM_000768100 gene=TsM_000768100
MLRWIVYKRKLRGIQQNSLKPGQRSSSKALLCNPADVSTSVTKAALSSTQSSKCFASELHPSDHDHEQPDSTRPGRLMVHPYTRPKALTIRAYSANGVFLLFMVLRGRSCI